MNTEKIKKLYKFHAKIYDITRPFFLLWRWKALSYIWDNSTKRIIDYGCGTGLNYSILQKKWSHMNYLWIDISENMLYEAKSKYKYWNFRLQDIESSSEYCDIALCTYVLSMHEKYEEVIQTLYKNLSDGWICIVLDFYPFTGYLHRFFPLLKYFYLSWVDPNKPLVSILKKTFFEVEVIISPYGHHFICVCKK